MKNDARINDKLYILLAKNKELILYVFFGGCTTLINIFAFFVLDTIIKSPLIVSNVVAWVFAVVFAFLTNKYLVFESVSKGRIQSIKEMATFFCVRIITLIIDTFLMWLFVEIVLANSLVAKVIVNIVVVVLNYLASKLWIFKR